MKLEEQIVFYLDKYWSWWGGRNAAGFLNIQHLSHTGVGRYADPSKCRVVHGEEYRNIMKETKRLRKVWKNRELLKEFGLETSGAKIIRAKDAKSSKDGLLIRVNEGFFVLIENGIKTGDTVQVVNLDKIEFMIVEDGDMLRKAQRGDKIIVRSVDILNESFAYSAGGCKQKGYLSQVEKVK